MIFPNFYWKPRWIHLTFESHLTSIVMAYMNNMNFHTVSNSRVSSRVRQILVLVSTILIGMLVSVFVNI